MFMWGGFEDECLSAFTRAEAIDSFSACPVFSPLNPSKREARSTGGAVDRVGLYLSEHIIVSSAPCAGL